MKQDKTTRQDKTNTKRRIRSGRILSGVGILLLFCAFGLLVYNLYDSERAQRASEEIAGQIEEYREEQGDDLYQNRYDPDAEMPEVIIDGVAYIGTLQVPSLGLDLPVISSWSYDYLKLAPCRYTGSIYSNDMVIAAHNYSRHFGEVRWLEVGSEIIFIDMNNNTFYYEIVESEILEPTQVEEMENSPYDLTLFTCVTGGQARHAIRCNRVEK